MEKIDLNNVNNLMGNAKPETIPSGGGKGTAERMVAIYLLRRKGYTTRQIQDTLGLSYNIVTHSVTMVRRAKTIKKILQDAGLNIDDV